MTECMDLGDIKILTYLNVNNPWRWDGNIKNILDNSPEEDFFQIFNEICLAFHINSEVEDKIFMKYFEDIFEKRIINPKIETEKFGKGGEDFADIFFEERTTLHNINLDDMKKIYLLWRQVGFQKKFDMSFYPDNLEEIFN